MFNWIHKGQWFQWLADGQVSADSRQGQSEEDPFSNTQLGPKHHPAYQPRAAGQQGLHPLENHPQAAAGGDAQQAVAEEDVLDLSPQFLSLWHYCDNDDGDECGKRESDRVYRGLRCCF